MKRGILILVLALVCVSSVYACSDSQRIMKLSGETNAHGAVFSDANYNVEICYDEIFGSSYSGANPHDCLSGDGNLVLKLSSLTNAHAETKTGTNYNTDVCYGDLVCEARSSCNADEELIVSLSSETNAHLSILGGYNTKICCKSGMVVEGAYWADMHNIETEITEADLNDTVRLVVAGGGMENEEIDYEVWKDIAWWFDFKISGSSSVGYTTWKAGLKDDGTSSGGDYYFKATIASTGEEFESDILTVSDIINNSEPFAEISSLVDRGVYFVTTTLLFEGTAYDEDDVVSVRWYVNGNPLTEKENMTSFTYQFPATDTGQKNIVLEVRNSRGQIASDRVSILMIASKYVLAYISEPPWGEIIGEDNVKLNANLSFCVDSNPSGVFCIAGPCPPATSDPVPVPIQNSPQPVGNLNFSWMFYDKNANGQWVLQGGGLFNASGASGSNFTWIFGTGEYKASLSVYGSGPGQTETEFSVIALDAPACGYWLGEPAWFDDNGIHLLDDEDEAGACSGFGTPGEDCCEDDYVCDEEGIWCVYNPDDDGDSCGEVTDFGDYPNQSCCENNEAGIGWEAQVSSRECGEDVGCDESVECDGINFVLICHDLVWDEEEEECTYTSSLEINPYDPNNPSCFMSSAAASECVDGQMTVTRTKTVVPAGAEFPDPPGCNDDELIVPCGIPVATLSFFTWENILISIIVIVLFYIIWIKLLRQKKEGKKVEKAGKKASKEGE